MKRAIKKLHSQSGVSILMALLLMLVAAMVSAVILSAAVTAAERVYDDRGTQQDTLSLNSAARLFVKLLQNQTYKYYQDEYPSDYSGYYDASPQVSPAPNNSPYVSFLTKAGEDLDVTPQYDEENDPDHKKPFVPGGVLRFALPDGYEGLQHATVEIERVYQDKLETTAGDLGQTTRTYYTLSGVLYLGSDAGSSSQKLYFSAQMDREKSEQSVTMTVPVPDHEPDEPDTKEINGTRTTETWHVGTLYLASSSAMLLEKEGS